MGCHLFHAVLCTRCLPTFPGACVYRRALNEASGMTTSGIEVADDQETRPHQEHGTRISRDRRWRCQRAERAGRRESGQGSQGQLPIINEQTVGFVPDDLAQLHDSLSYTLRAAMCAPWGSMRRNRRTLPQLTTRNTARMPTRVSASHGQTAPKPSAPQKTPKLHSSAPTLHFSQFSGTRVSGWWSTRPTKSTSRLAARAPPRAAWKAAVSCAPKVRTT